MPPVSGTLVNPRQNVRLRDQCEFRQCFRCWLSISVTSRYPNAHWTAQPAVHDFKKALLLAPRSQTPAFDTWSVPDQAPDYHFRQRESFPDYSQQLVEKVLSLVDCYQQNMHTEGYSPFHFRFQEAESRSSSLLICSLFVVGHNSFSPHQQAVSRLSSLSFSCWPY